MKKLIRFGTIVTIMVVALFTVSYGVMAQEIVASDTQSVSVDVPASVAVPVVAYAPLVTGVSVPWVDSSEATITWTTNIPADTQVLYGLDDEKFTEKYSSTTLDTTLTTSHSVTVKGLTASTTYFFRARSGASGLYGGVSQYFTTTQHGNPEIKSFSVDSTPSDRSKPITLEWKTSGGIESCTLEALSNTYLWKIFGSYAGVPYGKHGSISVTIPAGMNIGMRNRGTSGYAQIGCYTEPFTLDGSTITGWGGTYIYKTVPIVIPGI